MKNVIKKIIEKSRILKYFKDKNQLMILNYHRLNDPNKINLFDDGVFGPDAERFEQEMTWLKAETNIISESEMVDMLKNKIKPDGVCSMVTFDDGYIDNYEIAYPIIKKHSIPAIFFIPTKLINDRMLGWWDIASYLVKKSSKSKIIFREINWDINNKKMFIAKILFELKIVQDHGEIFLRVCFQAARKIIPAASSVSWCS